MRIAAIIPAAGMGNRMGGAVPKQFLELGSLPMLVHTLTVFENWAGVEDIVVVVSAIERDRVNKWVNHYRLRKVTQIVCGGPRRQDSVYNGLEAIGDNIDIVLVHDGVRPLVTEKILQSCANKATHTGAAIVAIPVTNTIKEADENKAVIRTPDRNRMWSVQTPQGFRRKILIKAMEQAQRDSFTGTDDASLVERLNVPITIVEGSYENIKITNPEDLILAEAILKSRKNAKSRTVF